MELTNLEFEALKSEFKNLLLSTNRTNIDRVLDWLDKSDFYEAPSSRAYHGNYKHGLLIHSMNVYKIASRIAEQMTYIKPDVVINDDSVKIAALFHDLCKANFYKTEMKWRKDANDQWEQYPAYVIEDRFPFGHGEKSVLMLNMLGLEMKADEMLAIRWHMSAWDGGILQNEVKMSSSTADKMYPLCSIIQCADKLASSILEEKI